VANIKGCNIKGGRNDVMGHKRREGGECFVGRMRRIGRIGRMERMGRIGRRTDGWKDRLG
jgi:hypothetical protein